MAGEIDVQEHGSLISHERGTASVYALEHLQQRGTFFVRPGEEVYAGQVVGQTIRNEDLVINVCRTKHLTGHRAAPKTILDSLSPARILTLDEAIGYLNNDELLEVTPKALRVRKRELQHSLRYAPKKTPRKKNRPMSEASGTKFQDLALAEPVLKSLAEVGYEIPTPIQEQTIPLVLAGRDVVGQAANRHG